MKHKTTSLARDILVGLYFVSYQVQNRGVLYMFPA